jgi:uncharacterized membrane protein
MAENAGGDFFIAPSKKSVDDFKTVIDRDYQVTIFDWLQRGWELFKKDAGPCIVFAVITVVLYGIATWLIPFGIGSTVIGLPLLAGFIIMALLQLRNQNTDFAKYFSGFRHFVPLLLFTVVSTAFILIGTMLFVLPGIYVTVAYLFAPFLIVDKNVDFWPAMEISRKKVNRHWFGLFAFSVVLVFINLLGLIPLGIGLFITLPWSLYTAAIAYEDIFNEGAAFGAAPAGLQKPPSGPEPA